MRSTPRSSHRRPTARFCAYRRDARPIARAIENALGHPRLIAVDPAFRFDLTAAVVRGFATSVVDRIERIVEAGELDERDLDALPTTELAARLSALRGIGPWTASVVALRGFGRLDTFPPGDSGIARDLALAGATRAAFADALLALGRERGMLYHIVHLDRLVRAGDATI